MSKSQLKKRVAQATVAAVIAGGSVLALGTPSASASAYGCSAWGAGMYGKYPYAKGGYCVKIDGKGTHVNSVGGGFDSVGNVCNWNITAEFFDKAGHWYKTFTGPLHSSCSHHQQDAIWIGANERIGFMCSTLKSNGTRLTSVCHNITY